MVSEKIEKELDSDLPSKGDAAVEESVVGLPEGFFLVFFEHPTENLQRLTIPNPTNQFHGKL